jgi:ankyrin repeat protein
MSDHSISNGEGGVDDVDDIAGDDVEDDGRFFGIPRDFVYPAGELGARQRVLDMKFAEVTDRVYGAKKIIKKFIEKGIPIDHVFSPTGETVLFEAENGADVDIMLAAGVPRDLQNIHGDTVLHIDSDDGVLYALMQAGADPHGIQNKLGKTPAQMNRHLRRQIQADEMFIFAKTQIELLQQIRDMMHLKLSK